MTINQLIDKNYHPITGMIYVRRKEMQSEYSKSQKAERDKKRRKLKTKI